MPVFLGSSFAFIAPIAAVVEMVTARGGTDGLAYARGGIMVAGMVYVVVAGLIYVFGVKKRVFHFLRSIIERRKLFFLFLLLIYKNLYWFKLWMSKIIGSLK